MVAFITETSTVQLQSGPTIADWDAQSMEEGRVVPLVAGQGVAIQRMGGILLALGPQALPTDIGAHPAEDLRLHLHDQHETTRDPDEQGHDHVQLRGGWTAWHGRFGTSGVRVPLRSGGGHSYLCRADPGIL